MVILSYTVSLASKLYNSKEEASKIWNKQFVQVYNYTCEKTFLCLKLQYYKSNEITLADIESFGHDKGLRVMFKILKDTPELMLLWTDISKIFTHRIYSYDILRCIMFV